MTKYVPIVPIRDFLFDTFNRLIFVFSVLVVRGNNTLPSAQQIRYPSVADNSKYTFSIWAFQEEHYIDKLRDGVPLFNQTNLLTRPQVDKAFGDRIATFESYRKRFDPQVAC